MLVRSIDSIKKQEKRIPHCDCYIRYYDYTLRSDSKRYRHSIIFMNNDDIFKYSEKFAQIDMSSDPRNPYNDMCNYIFATAGPVITHKSMIFHVTQGLEEGVGNTGTVSIQRYEGDAYDAYTNMDFDRFMKSTLPNVQNIDVRSVFLDHPTWDSLRSYINYQGQWYDLDVTPSTKDVVGLISHIDTEDKMIMDYRVLYNYRDELKWYNLSSSVVYNLWEDIQRKLDITNPYIELVYNKITKNWYVGNIRASFDRLVQLYKCAFQSGKYGDKRIIYGDLEWRTVQDFLDRSQDSGFRKWIKKVF